MTFTWDTTTQEPARKIQSDARAMLAGGSLKWLSVERKRWRIDAERAIAEYPELAEHTWFRGVIVIEPERDEIQTESLGEIHWEQSLVAYLTEESVRESFMSTPGGVPPEITESLAKFQQDHPDPRKTAFIMMRFGNTDAHAEIGKAIRDTLQPLGITAVRADDKEYHDELWSNVRTYLHGCGICVAVFERLQTNDFNPNVALEVGYMMALRRPMCMLKDQTLPTLHTDLVSKLYRTFDPQNPTVGIKRELANWIKERGLA